MAENRFFKEVPNALVAIGAIMVIFVIIIPLPTALLDFFMALNLIFSLIILLIVLFVDKPTEFTVFPSLLLVSTIFGLALNVSSTRLILTYGEKFNGKMIAAFSQFVIGSTGNQGLVIGFVVFIILIAVQAFVITKGATRIAEVAARFALDFNNTRSMSIEAEYNAGVITEAEARKKKEDLQRSTDFYGAMDGASKFVSGNVKIGIFITVLNIVAGLIVGIVFRQEEFTKAMQMYTRFTIGDGLLAQLPSLFISVATGLVVTRSASTGSFGKDITDQFSRNSTVYYIAAITLTVMAVLPGFPSIILIIIALSLAFLGWRLQTTKVTRAQKEQAAKEAQAASEKAAKTETDDTGNASDTQVQVTTEEAQQAIEAKKDNIIVFSGGVSVSVKDGASVSTIESDRLVYNRSENTIEAEGNVRYTRKTGGSDEAEEFVGELLLFNIDGGSKYITVSSPQEIMHNKKNKGIAFIRCILTFL